MSNEDIKMSDVFELPLSVDGNTLAESSCCQHSGFFEHRQDEAAAHAINNYDPMALRIKELEAALIELMDKASECDSWESFPVQYLDDASKALEQSK